MKEYIETSLCIRAVNNREWCLLFSIAWGSHSPLDTGLNSMFPHTLALENNFFHLQVLRKSGNVRVKSYFLSV
jgi:hypothetical protein